MDDHFILYKVRAVKDCRILPENQISEWVKNLSTAAFCFNYFLVRACSGTILIIVIKKKIVRYAHVNLCHFFYLLVSGVGRDFCFWLFLDFSVYIFFVIIKLFMRKTCLDEVSIKLNNLVSYTYAIVNIRASARDYLSFRRLLQTTFENLTRNIYSPVLISKNIRKKGKNWTYLFVFCLFVYLFILLYFFSFLFFSFLSFILSVYIYLFIWKLSCIVNVFWLATPGFSKLGITW